jgi:HEAT repeat protein
MALSEHAEPIIGQICTADADTATRVVMPLVMRLGGALAPGLIEALGHEEDRNRRGRLVKALKAIGEPAFPALVDALRAQVWFVVRNTLSVLGDVGTPALAEPIGRKLEHGDPRVRRAAARALSKIGGADAERLLLTAIHDRDPETQAEVLLCLGAMKSTSAIPVPADMIKPKGFFSREVPMIRIAAEKALTAIDTPAARDALKSAQKRV